MREISYDDDARHDVSKPNQTAEAHIEILITPVPRQRKPDSVLLKKELGAHAILQAYFVESELG